MSAVLILNIFFITFVVVGMLLLLGWGIVTDRTVATRRTRLARRPARAGPPRIRLARTTLGALDFSPQ